MALFDTDSVQWSAEAQLRLKQVPFFARLRARQQVERLAQERGIDVITPDVLELARRELGQ
ncbi:MAG: PCP reductase family protein [Elainellaceae cyanobacterium]